MTGKVMNLLRRQYVVGGNREPQAAVVLTRR